MVPPISAAPFSMGPPAQTPRKQSTTTDIASETPFKTPLRTPSGSKIDQTSSTPIIDFNAIESQKENVQPLARGRSAHALSHTLTMQHKQRQVLLASQRKQHQDMVDSVENTDSDDPLEAWTKYVKWCIDNYPSGQTHESGLVPLLERATRTFKDSEQYTNDSRYLRLWILYARNVECARDVYNFLLANEIGTKLASLYEELAVVLEGQRLYQEADSIYKLGIARRANPIDRLKRRYQEYQNRILLTQQTAESSSVAGQMFENYHDALKAAMATVGRSMLGHKDTLAAGPTISHASNVLRGSGASVAAIGNKGIHGPVNNGRKLAVYQEDHHQQDHHSNPSSVAGPSSGSSRGWDDIGTVASRTQENLQADRIGPSVLGFQIGATGGVSKKPSNGLAVFRDSDDEDDDAAQDSSTPPTPIQASILSPKDLFTKSTGSKPATETDLLRKNPFLHWDLDAKRVPDPNHLDVLAHKPSSSSDKMTISNSQTNNNNNNSSSSGKQKSKSKTSKATISRSAVAAVASASLSSSLSCSRKEHHAISLALLYPSFSTSQKDLKRKAIYAQNGWQNETCIEELIVSQRTGLVFSEIWENEYQDPWAHLDQYQGHWIPEPAREQQTTNLDHDTSMTPGIVQQEDVHDVSMRQEKDVEEEKQPQSFRDSIKNPDPKQEPIPESEPTRTMPSRDVFDPDNSFANAVALNLRPKKKKNAKDATIKMTGSPTLVTKATLKEVESMFNGDSDSGSDDNDDDDESSEEEDDEDDDDRIAPLAAMSVQKPRMMLSASSADVPFTPTPASRQSRTLGQNDENAGIKSTLLPTSFGIRQPLGAATPLRTPLGTKPVQQPFNMGSKHVYRDEDEDDDNDDQEPVRRVRRKSEEEQQQKQEQQLQDDFQIDDMEGQQSLVHESSLLNHTPPACDDGVAAFTSTPMAIHRQPAARRMIESMAEQDEDDESDPEEINDHQQDDDFQPNMDNFRPQFQPLTPITEATCEFTRYTNYLQAPRTPATATKSNISQLPSAAEAKNESIDQQPIELTVGNQAFVESRDSDSGLQDSDGEQVLDESRDSDSGHQDSDGELAVETEKLLLAEGDEPTTELSDFNPPNPCSPVDAELISTILSNLSEPIETLSHYLDLSNEEAGGKLEELQKWTKNQLRRSVGSGSSGNKTCTLDIGQHPFTIREKLGQGGYGAVFLAEDVDNFAPSLYNRQRADEPEEEDEEEDEEDEEEAERKRMVAIKAESPSNPWEFYVLVELGKRLLKNPILDSIIHARKFVRYRQESLLLLDYGEKGTLLEVVNHASSAGVASMASSLGTGMPSGGGGGAGVNGGAGAGGVDEVLAMFFVIELLKVVNQLHRNDIIHGDLKIDNCLLRLDDTPLGTNWSNVYTRDGSLGWSQKGLVLIDFGRSIDLTVYPIGQEFIANWETDQRDCAEMRKSKPYTYQTDYYGIASVAYCLLFGKYIETVSYTINDEDGGGKEKFKIQQPLKRYWQTQLWSSLFDMLLNPVKQDPSSSPLPIIHQLDQMTNQMQDWLEANCNRGGKNLKGLIRKLEIWAMKRAT